MKITGKKSTIIDFIVDDSHPCVFHVKDISEYQNFNKNCITLFVVPPGYSDTSAIQVENLNPEFSLIVDKCLLGIQQSGCGEYREELMDGNYYFELNINGSSFGKNVYRINKLLGKYYDLLCCVEKKYRDTYFINDLYDGILEVRVKMDSIKSLAEKCNCPDKADFLYKEAEKVIKNLRCRYCGCD